MKPSTSAAAAKVDDPRVALLHEWLASLSDRYNIELASLRPASVDASFRRYFRLDSDRGSVIAMDAPPATENSEPFVRVAALMKGAGLHVPEILEADLQQGFLLLTDLGSTPYLSALTDENASSLFSDALDALIRWQLATRAGKLPPYDEALLRRELQLFPDWYVARHLRRELSASQSASLGQIFGRIVSANLAQPAVFVHRDYMPRNLMVSTPNPGVLDFQDAVIGPITYDVVSLFRDAFISWTDERVQGWCRDYWQRARGAGLPVNADFHEFWRDFDLMGVQRHLKVLGIFARIRYRDGKPHYLEDAPRFIRYIRLVSQRHDELTPLLMLFDDLELH